jgi:hypothetical protein
VIRIYKAIVHIAASYTGDKDPTPIICEYLEHLNGLGICVDSIELDPPDQEIPSSINKEDLMKLTENSMI